MEYGDQTTKDEAVVLPIVTQLAFNRNLADASNTVAYTGLGFRPSYIRIAGNINNTITICFGHTDTTSRSQFFQGSSGTWQRSVGGGGDCIIGVISPGNSTQGNVDSFDIDGFTISWIKTGSPTGTMNCSAECFK